MPTERGATTLAEFTRQRAKTIAAIRTMNAEIIGLMELENDAPPNSAIEDLVAGLNAATAPFALLTSAVDPRFVDSLNRPSLAQTFTQNSNGRRLTVVVNHLKSKGSNCNDVSDPDTGDGQGNCNLTRTNAAAALVRSLASDPTGAGDPDVLLIGDMKRGRRHINADEPVGLDYNVEFKTANQVNTF